MPFEQRKDVRGRFCQSVLCFLSLQVSLMEVRDYKFGVEEPVSLANNMEEKKKSFSSFRKMKVIHRYTGLGHPKIHHLD